MNDPLRDRLRQAYDAFAQEREAGGMQDWKLAVRAGFLELLQHEHKTSLLEIGAGTGRDGRFFQENGLEVVCIDLSPAMVALCRQKGLVAYEMDSGDLQFPEASFDAVYTMNSLLHLPKAELPGVLARIEQLLRPGGLFFMGVYGGFDFEGVWDGDHYEPKRFFSFYTNEKMHELVAQFFEVVSFTPIFLDRSPDQFQAIVLRNRTIASS